MQLPFLLVLSIAVLMLGLLLFVLILSSKLNKRCQVMDATLTDKQQTIDILFKELEQIQQVVMLLSEQVAQVEKSNKLLEEKLIESVEQHRQQLDNIKNTEPADKLYSRALKLVAKGADLEELMQECELPQAEAELLLSIHQKQV